MGPTRLDSSWTVSRRPWAELERFQWMGRVVFVKRHGSVPESYRRKKNRMLLMDPLTGVWHIEGARVSRKVLGI